MKQGELVVVIPEWVAECVAVALNVLVTMNAATVPNPHTIPRDLFIQHMTPDYVVGSFGTIEPIDSEFANSIRNSVDKSRNS
jgi:hypothetical protein